MLPNPSMISRSSAWLFLGALCLFGTDSGKNDRFRLGWVMTADAQDCDFGPDSLTDAFETPIPQTCIDVPYEDDGSTTLFLERCFYTYFPSTCSISENSPVPLVVDVHGFQSCPSGHASYSGWKEKAEEDCFVVVWPSGNNLDGVDGTCWNIPGSLRSDDFGTPGGNNVITTDCCCIGREYSTEPNDPLFLKMLIDSMLANNESSSSSLGLPLLDPSRVYMAGHSNGCITSLAMAALYSDTIAAVCCHAGGLLTPFAEDYTPVPIWMVHGMKDYDILYDGRIWSTTPSGEEIGEWSKDQTVDYLAEKNGCKQASETEVLDGDKVVGTAFSRTDCHPNASADVNLVALFESGHFPYKDLPFLLSLYVGLFETPTTIDTTAMAWEFCSSHVKGLDKKEVEEELEDTDPTGIEEEIEEEGAAAAAESVAWKLCSGKWFGISLAASIFAIFV